MLKEGKSDWKNIDTELFVFVVGLLLEEDFLQKVGHDYFRLFR